MKYNRIISAALMCALLFMSFATLLPVHSSATYSENIGSSEILSVDVVKSYIDECKGNAYASDADMLAADQAKGYIDSVTTADGAYSIFVNRVNGIMYYRNNLTQQILCSNPSDLSTSTNAERLLSQIVISYYETSNSTQKNTDFNSTKYAAERGQISVSPIENGLRVSYTLGDTATRYLAPGLLVYETFLTKILKPLITGLEEMIAEYCSEQTSFPEGGLDYFADEKNYKYDAIYYIDTRVYIEDLLSEPYVRALKNSNPEQYEEIQVYVSDASKLVDYYALKNPVQYQMLNDMKSYEADCILYPILKEGIAVFANNISDGSAANLKKRELGNLISKYLPDYSFSDMYEDEREAEYKDITAKNPVFRCALEYTFNEDGSLSVSLPASSITFDDAYYTMKSITALPYFAAADMGADGYAFYPDGSGTIISFDDFYSNDGSKKNNIVLSSSVYGQDYCYSKITGSHREQITMPVYGMVTERTMSADMVGAINGAAIGDTFMSGFFAVIEEGATLAQLELIGDASATKYIGIYASYNPYPSDTFDLSETISVGSLGAYTITSSSKFTGSYKTRYVMLSDSRVNTKLTDEDATHYDASYVGMSAFYRDYLYDTGVLSELEQITGDIPLYVEALGSMTIDAKFLSFPIKKKVALTTFDDILAMYHSFSTAQTDAINTYNDLMEKAEAEEDAILKAQYETEADVYLNIYNNCQNITNIVFKLTGFANGGMYSTYPAKLKFERVVGGRRGFKELIAAAKDISKDADANLSIYPDVNFMYIENTSAFDGISIKKSVSRMVDNRYASRQQYDMIAQEYETDMALVISPDVLSAFFKKFAKKYGKYDIDTLAVSNLGSDLNSNFYEKNPINREEAMGYVKNVLSEMAEKYDLLVETGNIYSIQYATHVLNAQTDASHFKYASYVVPFVGMVLHGSVNYASSALNYSGSPKYEILRALESGAAPYYILCYQKNTSHMKEDEKLSEYYSVDYENWFTSVVETYSLLNAELGSIQGYYITDHRTLIAERVIDEAEVAYNNNLLKEELLVMLDDQLEAAIHEKMNEMKENNVPYGCEFVIHVDTEALLEQFAEIMHVDVSELAGEFTDRVNALVAQKKSDNERSEGGNRQELTFDAITYENSAYDFITTSESTLSDDEYDFTDYTVDNGNVVMVTYSKGNETKTFVLNYNIYAVTVILNGKSISIDAYGYYPG